MSVPDEVIVLGKRYRLVGVDQHREGLMRGAPYSAMGGTDYYAGVVVYRQVGEDCSADEEADTVLHEVLHIACVATRLDQVGKSGPQVEDWVGRLTPVFLDLLRRNPALVAYLVEQKKPGEAR